MLALVKATSKKDPKNSELQKTQTEQDHTAERTQSPHVDAENESPKQAHDLPTQRRA